MCVSFFITLRFVTLSTGGIGVVVAFIAAVAVTFDVVVFACCDEVAVVNVLFVVLVIAVVRFPVEAVVVIAVVRFPVEAVVVIAVVGFPVEAVVVINVVESFDVLVLSNVVGDTETIVVDDILAAVEVSVVPVVELTIGVVVVVGTADD